MLVATTPGHQGGVLSEHFVIIPKAPWSTVRGEGSVRALRLVVKQFAYLSGRVGEDEARRYIADTQDEIVRGLLQEELIEQCEELGSRAGDWPLPPALDEANPHVLLAKLWAFQRLSERTLAVLKGSDSDAMQNLLGELERKVPRIDAYIDER